MKLHPETVSMPASLASALINGDFTGLEEDDLKWVQVAIDYCKPGRIVSCSEESYFATHCDLPGFKLGADMLDYVVLYEES